VPDTDQLDCLDCKTINKESQRIAEFDGDARMFLENQKSDLFIVFQGTGSKKIVITSVV
jgi:hypothetical protein